MTKSEIAFILKKCRLDANLTQREAAAAISRPQQTLASWETGKSQPDANTLFQLCDLYGVSVDQAFGYSRNESFHFVSPSEYDLVTKFRALDARGREAVLHVLDYEYRSHGEGK